MIKKFNSLTTIKITSVAILALFTAACVNTGTDDVNQMSKDQIISPDQTRTLLISSNKCLVALLITNDNFNTAKLVDVAKNKSYDMEIAPSGSGMRLVGKDGVGVQLKGDEGILNFKPNVNIKVKISLTVDNSIK